MQKVTIDTNCLIDLEEDRETAQFIRAIRQMLKQRKIALRVVAVSASERKQDSTYAVNFVEFKKKLSAVGLEDVDILKPIGYWGASFWGYALWSSDEMVAFEERIHKVLFPAIEFKFADYCSARSVEAKISSADCKKWRNAKCDVLIMWAHIHYDGDILVTSDSNFFKETKKDALISLGAKAILSPEEAVEALQNYDQWHAADARRAAVDSSGVNSNEVLQVKLLLEIDTYDRKFTFDLMEVTTLKQGTTRIIVEDAVLEYQGTVVRKAIGIPETVEFVLSFGTGVTSGVLATWLYEKIKGRAERIRIDRIEIRFDQGEIERIIKEKIEKSA